MPKNTLAPGFIDFQYSTLVSGVTLTHHQRLGINPAVWSGQTTTLTPKSGAPVLWTAALVNYADVWDDCFFNTSVLIGAELWRQDTPTSDPVFQGTGAINRAGVGAVATVSMGQALFSMFGSDDSQMRVTLIESLFSTNARTAYGALGAGAGKSFFDYFFSNPCVFWTRGNSYVATLGFFTTKINDRMRKIRLGL